MRTTLFTVMVFGSGLLVGVTLRSVTSKARGDEPAAGGGGSMGTDMQGANVATVWTVDQGDHLTVMWKLTTAIQIPVRLAYANSPMRGMQGGPEAAEALAQLVYGKQVRLEFENPQQPDQDYSNNVFAYVFLSDGTLVNQKMIESGWARFSGTTSAGKYADQLEAAQKQAKADGKGLWAMRKTDQ